MRLFMGSTSGEKGKVCRVCDAKHVLRQNYLPQKQELQFYNKEIAMSNEEDEQMKEELAIKAQ